MADRVYTTAATVFPAIGHIHLLAGSFRLTAVSKPPIHRLPHSLRPIFSPLPAVLSDPLHQLLAFSATKSCVAVRSHTNWIRSSYHTHRDLLSA